MEVTFDIDTNIWPYETIKLILQPFIENVLKHAWSGDRIHIRVSVQKEGDDILYRIIDDGLGMKQERIQEILDPQDHSHTGAGFETLTSGCNCIMGANTACPSSAKSESGLRFKYAYLQDPEIQTPIRRRRGRREL